MTSAEVLSRSGETHRVTAEAQRGEFIGHKRPRRLPPTRSKGGKPIIALPATAKGGTQSRIQPFLQHGAGVVTTRADVHYVVTEYGIANLFGKNLRQRAEALIEIAAPQFREELLSAAKERKLLA